MSARPIEPSARIAELTCALGCVCNLLHRHISHKCNGIHTSKALTHWLHWSLRNADCSLATFNALSRPSRKPSSLTISPRLGFARCHKLSSVQSASLGNSKICERYVWSTTTPSLTWQAYWYSLPQMVCSSWPAVVMYRNRG